MSINLSYVMIPDTKPEEGLNLQQTESDRIANSADRLYPRFKDANNDGLWEETFGGQTDSKPKGYSYVYEIPEHASPLSLKTTRCSSQPENKGSYTNPYRLWNLDVFEYEHDSEMALYVGVFWLNSSKTWVDAEKEQTKLDAKRSWKPSTTLTSSSDAHDHDQGPSDTTNTTHWIRVVHNFDKFDIPLDVFWLDIEYVEEHKYFIWNKKAFPEPLKMTNKLESTG
ncbi:hypothetical protein PPACK8108_LOCUS1490 [Phakopsora pachyrhizi]|uniref:Uncharacterized protein n=1 Tax=Phakopsora pachyrhizi TaxID=170000 RepID=A0AAV0AG17_PHAPC|nr:hypothetical protein PPACK8108_LOCUS1490 [Phakopsora pachyrhizi]